VLLAGVGWAWTPGHVASSRKSWILRRKVASRSYHNCRVLNCDIYRNCRVLNCVIANRFSAPIIPRVPQWLVVRPCQSMKINLLRDARCASFGCPNSRRRLGTRSRKSTSWLRRRSSRRQCSWGEMLSVGSRKRLMPTLRGSSPNATRPLPMLRRRIQPWNVVVDGHAIPHRGPVIQILETQWTTLSQIVVEWPRPHDYLWHTRRGGIGMGYILCVVCGRGPLDVARGLCQRCWMRDFRRRRRMKIRTCIVCRKAFSTSRTDARLCSARCRQAAHRGKYRNIDA